MRPNPTPPTTKDPTGTQTVEENIDNSTTTNPSTRVAGKSRNFPGIDDDAPTSLKDIKSDGSSTNQVCLSHSHHINFRQVSED